MKKRPFKYILSGLLLLIVGYVIISSISGRKTGNDVIGKTVNSNVTLKNKAKIAVKSSRKKTALRHKFGKDYPENVSDNVKNIIDGKLSFRSRLKAVHALSRNLSKEDRDALYQYLHRGKNNKNTYVLKNDILNALRDQKIPPKELTNVMLDIFYDKNQDIVVRSYVLQHMRPWYLDEQQKDPAIVQAFYDGLKETDNEIAGVALLALRYLSEQAPAEFDKDFISEQAAVIAENENTYILTRISAVGVCGKMNSSQALPVIRNLAVADNPVTLRVAAIASLGEIGDSSDIEYLQKVADGRKPFSVAAKTAIKKLQRKY